MAKWHKQVELITGISERLQSNIITTVTALIAAFLIVFLIRQIIWRQTQDIRRRYNTYKIATYVVSFITILIIGRIWFKGAQSLAT